MENKFLILGNQKTEIQITETAVVIELYYEENLDFYLSYVANIPNEIDRFFLSSNGSVLEKISMLYAHADNTYFIKKKNRGRDISALLVAFYPYLHNYRYIGFLHDKRAKHDYLKEDFALWLDNLWGNMLFSQDYIRNVIELLEREKYGILLPPKPIGKYMDSMYSEPWNDDYERVKELAVKLKLKESINKNDVDMISIGSVFWCRVEALEKLFCYKWGYEDFPMEPMPNDGTISHAIERIFGFVAADTGYKVGTIMNPIYSGKIVEIMQKKLQITYNWLWNNLGIKNSYQLYEFNEEQKIISRMFEENDKVYLYGAGNYGEKYLKRLLFWGYEPSGFVVSNGKKTEKEYCGYTVSEVREIRNLQDIGIIITTNPELQDVIANDLEQLGFNNYYKAVVV